MYNFSTKVNKLKIRFFCFQKIPYFFLSNLSRKAKWGKATLFPY